MAPDPDEGEDGEGDGREWRFSLADIEERNQGEESEDGDTGGNVAGSLRPDDEIEAGDVDLENALFVLVGIALAVLVVIGFVNIFP